MDIIIIALLKMLDNILLTTKTILTSKGKKLYVAFIIFISQLLFYFVVQKVVESDSVLFLFVASLSASVGSYIAFPINERLKKDDMWVNVVTARNEETMYNFVDYLRDNKIKNIVFRAVNRHDENTLAIQIFARTKCESRLIDEYVDTHKDKIFRKIW